MTPLFRLLALSVAVCFIAGAAVVRDEKPRTLKGWGKVTDPDGDCTVKAGKGKITLTVPGGTHDLNAATGMNGPRVLKEVEGDFTAQVKVTGDFDPGDKAANPRTSPFNGAGLLVWQDEKNYIRLERNRWWVADQGKYACYPPLVEYFQDGEYKGTDPDATTDDFFKGRSTWLKIERQGDKVIASYSHDGKKWAVAKEIEAALPKKVQVGVAAVNTSTQPFTVEFAESKVATK
ncbi:MAG TPA: DUF1349 domain-containing protein [Gemmataceae bacterium]|jgi:regulation of enolase protein 1 (concanavalin A-like superfamily)|nr:DUF1349 domain-containing protein [Gemmataceae bacterium]